MLLRRHRLRKRVFRSESVFPLDSGMATIRTAIILIPIIGVTISPWYTGDLATIGITATVSIITTGGTGKTIFRNFYELAGKSQASSFRFKAWRTVAPRRALKSLAARTC